MEVWKDIIGFEQYYQVSNCGRVKSLGNWKSRKEKILKPIINSIGYPQVALKSKKFLVHRIVAITFLPNPKSFPVIHHKDENPLNTCVSNLEWCSQSINQLYSTKRLGSDCFLSKIKECDVLRIIELSKHLKVSAIAKEMGIPYTTIWAILNGRTWNHLTGFPRQRYIQPKFKVA